MQEDWLPIYAFEGYSVSNFGRVINHRRESFVRLTKNAQGVGIVGLLSSDGHHSTRSVALLVAKAFLPNEEDPDIFNTPINLNGDRLNCHVENLMWRPRWFATRFHHQFASPVFQSVRRRFEEITTGEIFEDFVKPCTTYGICHTDIALSYLNGARKVFPTWQRFRLVNN